MLQLLADVRDPESRAEMAAAFQHRSRLLLEARDRFVADRIDATLRDGEWGLLFMGLMHGVEQHLPHDIAVQYLLPEADGEQPGGTAASDPIGFPIGGK